MKCSTTPKNKRKKEIERLFTKQYSYVKKKDDSSVAKENHAKFASPWESLRPHVTYVSHQATAKYEKKYTFGPINQTLGTQI